MGSNNSKSEEDQPPPLLSKPWRTINWGDTKSPLQYVNNYKPQTEGVQLRILLHGLVGAGKSSFINSVQSVLRGRMCAQALVDNNSHDCFTKKYTTYKILKGSPDPFYPFVFNDIMGLSTDKGVHVADVKLALKGHVKEGYRFNPESSLPDNNDRYYNKSPSANDKVHVLVCVVSANTIFQMRDQTVQKILDIRKEASDLGVPQVAILTKIDEACPEIKQDIKNVYRVRKLKLKMEQFSADSGIPMNCIFPVKNYHEEINLDSDVDSLLLSAMRNIINFGDDCLNFHRSQPEGSH